ncbi:uncharacterized protein BO88DRAFT_185219 [Aspergillus vadensis CBS 113365]|uniref:Uncharacterized protein n=1 Tax=Aspergillus vadensis (strain CBS 113365 / IMI 142717 / IBT 24658) TaxID=1448311 RepID=A0A319AXT5_ASPVC|nr:hypothetical protein BO88DRAFT_185219 [Aspergillus vadensis CBS 113365]PYH64231.1 hypothetical protein BO88DRAFT_185219 [Aspergillus vadensis CBS 113365]
MLSLRRFASKERQSSTTSDPWVKAPSASIKEKIRSNAFSNATSFWNSSEAGVRAIRRIKASIRCTVVISNNSTPRFRAERGAQHTIAHRLSSISQCTDQPRYTQRRRQDTFLCSFWPCARDLKHQLQGIQARVKVTSIQEVKERSNIVLTLFARSANACLGQ